MLPNDGLPTIVCNTCRTQLDTCQQFRDKAQSSQQKLQNFLKFANKLTGDPQVWVFKLLSLRLILIYKNKLKHLQNVQNIVSLQICWKFSWKTRNFFFFVYWNKRTLCHTMCAQYLIIIGRNRAISSGNRVSLNSRGGGVQRSSLVLVLSKKSWFLRPPLPSHERPNAVPTRPVDWLLNIRCKAKILDWINVSCVFIFFF